MCVSFERSESIGAREREEALFGKTAVTGIHVLIELMKQFSGTERVYSYAFIFHKLHLQNDIKKEPHCCIKRTTEVKKGYIAPTTCIKERCTVLSTCTFN